MELSLPQHTFVLLCWFFSAATGVPDGYPFSSKFCSLLVLCWFSASAGVPLLASSLFLCWCLFFVPLLHFSKAFLFSPPPVVPEVKKFRTSGIDPEFEAKLDQMFMGIVATGDKAWAPSSGDEYS
ncbi:uncharacterized protein LOC128033888 [Gossypium raimondii]|uniref:uncharacterized protein LOC128033888 n=1 Tax=Gossypium raimondii TaxID=29730 RepID=UPI00227BA4B5|nr:uncharacterized protein LOC128033888 [Gossypium raimondii]